MGDTSSRARLQKHLSLLRCCAGWTAEVFAKKLEISRATVSTLEKPGHELTMIQYLAIHKLFEDEIRNAPEETCMLEAVLETIVDSPEKYSAEERREVLERARLMAPTILKVPSERKTMSAAWAGVLIASGIALSATLLRIVGKRN